jgi:hypothetical protein
MFPARAPETTREGAYAPQESLRIGALGVIRFSVRRDKALAAVGRTGQHCGSVKCFKHDTEAVAVCPYCGRAMCADCASASASAAPRLACSEECAQALGRNDAVLQLLLQKSRQSARANSVYCYLCGALSAGGAVAAYYFLPVPMLIWFLVASAVALIISGAWFGRGAGKMNLESPPR